MNARLALTWLQERWVMWTADRIAADEDKDIAKAREKAENQHRQALAEVEYLLSADPGEEEAETTGPSVERAEWLRAMGAEVA